MSPKKRLSLLSVAQSREGSGPHIQKATLAGGFFQKSGWSSAGNYLATRMMSASRQNSASFMYQNRWRRKTFC
jgi:hypothetical protein